MPTTLLATPDIMLCVIVELLSGAVPVYSLPTFVQLDRKVTESIIVM